MPRAVVTANWVTLGLILLKTGSSKYGFGQTPLVAILVGSFAKPYLGAVDAGAETRALENPKTSWR